jgi:hypothetical protein
MKKIGPLCLYLLLSACSTFAPPAPPQTVPSIPATVKTIAVLPEVPNQFSVEAAGTTFLESALDVVNVPDWHMRDLVYQAAAETLSPRFTVARAETDVFISDPESEIDKKWLHSTKFENLVRQHVRVDRSFDRLIDRLVDQPEDQASEPPIDLYVVISLSDVANIDVGMKNVYRGIGISKVKSPLKPHAPIVHTFMLVTVLDGKTFKTLGYSPLMVSPGDSKQLVDSDAVEGMPQQTMTSFDWHDKWADMSGAQKQRIESSVKNLLTKSVSYTLSLMLPPKTNESGN